MIETVEEIGRWTITIYTYCILFYVITSWIPALRENPLGKIVTKLVEPYLRLFRFIPPIGMIDISPVVAIFAFSYLSQFLLLGIVECIRLFV